MKNRSKNKHGEAFPFHPGNEMSEVISMPAYNSAGKEYKRILPKVRNQEIINTSILCALLQKLVPQNKVEIISGGLKINSLDITISEGIVITKTMKFRFRDLKDLLDNLVQENILIGNKLDLITIKHHYFKELNRK